MALLDSLRNLLASRGAAVVGCADVSGLEETATLGFPRAIAIGVAARPDALRGLAEALTAAYVEEVDRLRRLRSELAAAATEFLKTVATRAGLGWIGKSSLLITRDFGASLRWSVVLTDAPLVTGQPVESSSCGTCRECTAHCPAGAIRETNWSLGAARDELVDAFACREAKPGYAVRFGYGETKLCDVCIAVCPWTKDYIERSG
ncbi:MAG: 4Fe-4S double cluster binding domain-containing protein [Planctomycetota bacterium]